MPITESVTINAKIGALSLPAKTMDYERPKDFEEAIEMDGETKAFKTYLNERKTNFMDKERKQMIKDFSSALGKISPDKLREMGLQI